MHVPAIQGAFTARCFIFSDAARMDRKYVVLPEME